MKNLLFVLLGVTVIGGTMWALSSNHKFKIIAKNPTDKTVQFSYNGVTNIWSAGQGLSNGAYRIEAVASGNGLILRALKDGKIYQEEAVSFA